MEHKDQQVTKNTSTRRNRTLSKTKASGDKEAQSAKKVSNPQSKITRAKPANKVTKEQKVLKKTQKASAKTSVPAKKAAIKSTKVKSSQKKSQPLPKSALTISIDLDTESVKDTHQKIDFPGQQPLKKFSGEEPTKRRRSSRIEKQDSHAVYTIDKMSNTQFQNTLLRQEMEKSDEQLMKYAIHRSLVDETKYKNHNDKQPKQWFKNFTKEQNIGTLTKQTEQKQQAKKPAQQGATSSGADTAVVIPLTIEASDFKAMSKQIQTQETPPRNKREAKVKAKNNLTESPESEEKKSDHSNFSSSNFGALNEVGQDDGESQTEVDKKIEAKDELQDLLALNETKTQVEDRDDVKEGQFLAPLPIKKAFKKAAEVPKGDSFKLDVVNHMDLEIRSLFTPYVKFIDFKNNATTENALYGPALVQKQQESQKQADSAEDMPVSSRLTTASSEISNSQLSIAGGAKSTDQAKSHFIRKKQSHCNIKREGGVSYVKKSESKQENVRSRGYEKLPPIVIQGSYTLPKNNQRFYKDDDLENSVSLTINRLLFDEKAYTTLVISAFESVNEHSMKAYLLKPHKRLQIAAGKFWLVRKTPDQKSVLENLWRFVKDKYFLCIHFIYDPETLVKSIEDISDSGVQNFIIKSDVCLGFLPKKGNASVKSMLKVYKLEDQYATHMKCPSSTETLINCQGAQLSGINTVAFLSRLELYVQEKQWIQGSMFQKGALTSFINMLEDNMAQVLLEWNKQRTNLGSLKESTSIRKVTFGANQIKEALTSKIKAKDIECWKPLKSNFGNIKIDEQPDQWNSDDIMMVEDPLDIFNFLKRNSAIPVTLINTRDCFAYDLKFTEEVLNLGKGREKVIKKEYYFDPEIEEGYPPNYKQVLGMKNNVDMKDINNLKVGVTCYENFYTTQEMDEMEKLIEQTEEQSLKDEFLPMTAQKTFTGMTLKRTKFFFGYRYMWTRTQLQDPLANVAAGVRADVSQPPVWMKNRLEEPLVAAKIVDKNFINSVALNVYHDGSEGLAQHFDDATRFKQPIYTLRLFSDSRLSFGSQYYGFQNSAFTIPLPRGCICKMEEGSYSANGVKHCIRPCDMTGKSSAVILRQMHPNVIEEANKLDRNIDLPMWMSSLSLEDKAMPFYQQKELECQWLEKQITGNCGTKATTIKQERKATKTTDPSVRQIEGLLEDLVGRVEEKAIFEKQLHQKITNMRAKLRSSKDVVQLFNTQRISKTV